MDQDKITKVVDEFFHSLKTEADETLETGLSQNTTVEMLRQSCQELIKLHPKRFEQYVKFFEEGCMYLQDESDEIPEVENNVR